MKKQLLDDIQRIRQEAMQEIAALNDSQAALACRVKYLGKKGSVTAILRNLSGLSADDRPEIGKFINELKTLLDQSISSRLAELEQSHTESQLSQQRIDITLPGRKLKSGHHHPISQVMDEITEVFTGLGFSIHHGPEVESEFYNFSALNFSKDHPALDMHDTFYVEGGNLLRTHTSPVQIHVMEKQKPPVFVIAPGAVYRRDNDVSHSPMFHQVEGLMVDQGITFANLKAVLSIFCKQLFGKKSPVRFRPSFFPFTEPSAEIDIGCVICSGKGCRVCKQSGWVEIMGCGMVHPEVFNSVGYDSSKVTGFAFGMGVERIAMLKFGINDIRLFFENDLRFLRQF